MIKLIKEILNTITKVMKDIVDAYQRVR